MEKNVIYAIGFIILINVHLFFLFQIKLNYLINIIKMNNKIVKNIIEKG